MDFRLDDDQLALRETIGRFCDARHPLDGLADRPGPMLDRSAWAELADLGVLSLLPPEADGGLGLGVVGAAIVFEQLGAHLVPGPLVWSALAALHLPEVATGGRIAGGTIDDGTAPCFVEHADSIDTLLVLRPAGAFLVERPALGSGAPLDGLDPLNAISSFDRLPAGMQVGDPVTATRLRHVGTVLVAALQLGIAQASLDVAVAHSLEREQFGVPIGSFQALKHLMADMYVRVGLARSATYAGAAVLDDPAVGDADHDASAAKLLAGEAAIDNARGALQVLGGMGFTWEMPPNFLLKRAWVLDQTFGTGASHALAISAALAREVA